MRISDWSSDVCSSDLPTRTRCLLLRPSRPMAEGRRRKRHRQTTPKPPPKNQPRRLASQSHRHHHQKLQQHTQKMPRLPYSSRNLQRSEEHTSELQSLMRISYAVFCLKKKTNKQTN